MNENEARFYTAQVVLALEFLHSQGIAFRDLKVRPPGYAGEGGSPTACSMCLPCMHNACCHVLA